MVVFLLNDVWLRCEERLTHQHIVITFIRFNAFQLTRDVVVYGMYFFSEIEIINWNQSLAIKQNLKPRL